MSLRVVIADDEPIARAGLRAILERDDELEVVAVARTGREAAAAIVAHRADLVFLDIEMPELDGFGALEAVQGRMGATVVFVTGHAEHARRAFDVHAADYVLKPLRPARVLEAVSWAKTRHRGSARGGVPLAVQIGDRIRVFPQEALDWVEADNEHVVLHIGGARHRVREALSTIERRLDLGRFVRVHRSTIVNVARIGEIQPYFHGDCYVLLRDGTRLRVSRTHRSRLQSATGGW